MRINTVACAFTAALLAGPAIAQTGQSPSTTAPSAQQQTQPMAPAGQENRSTMQRPMASGSVEFLTSAQPNNWRASDLIGKDVYGAANEDIGEIEDVLIDRTGKVTAVVVSVGGFLGIGEKEVAVTMDTLKIGPMDAAATTGSVQGSPQGAQQGTAMQRDGLPDRIVLSATKQQLEAAPEFRDRDARATTDTAPPAQRTGPAAPSSRPANPQ